MVNSGILQALTFFKLISQNCIFDKLYMKEHFRNLLTSIPVECFMSKQCCQLLNEIGEVLCVGRKEEWVGVF